MNRFPAFSLDGKVAVVTGASSGIGTAIAQGLSDAGARVVLTGRNEGRLRACGESLGEHHVVVADLTAEDAAARIVGESTDAFGALNVLVHSAGIFWPKPFAEAPLDEFDEQFRVNVRAPYALTRAALPHLRPDGVVIFVSRSRATSASPTRPRTAAARGRSS